MFTANNVKKFLVSLAIYGTAGLIAWSLPPVRAFDFSVHGWAWLVLFVSAIGITAISQFMQGFLTGLLGNALKGVKHADEALTFAGKVWEWLTIGFAVVITALALPQDLTYSSGLGGLLLVLIIGIAAAFDTLIERKYFPKNKSDKK